MISVILAYCNRIVQLRYTLQTISLTKHRNFEIIIVDDFSEQSQRPEILLPEFPQLNIRIIYMSDIYQSKWYINPCIPYNEGLRHSRGNKIILQNPECCHIGDILEYVENNLTENLYLSFHCFALNQSDTEKLQQGRYIEFNNLTAEETDGSCWYNHRTIRPTGYHFACAITKQKLLEINGFDENFAHGIGFDDDEILHRIIHICRVKFVESPMVIHQYHSNAFSDHITVDKIEKNKLLFEKTQKSKTISNNNKIELKKTWLLNKIPKIMHLYWGGGNLSYLRYLTAASFRKHNPDWEIVVHTPKKSSTINKTWSTHENVDYYTGPDYLYELQKISNLKFVYYDFDKTIVADSHEVHRSDLIRWHILSTTGGLWSDFDIIYTKPMTSLAENNLQYSNTDVFLCLLDPDEDLIRYYTIGFMMSSPSNVFFKTMYQLSHIKYNPTDYQSIGANLLNAHFIDIEEIKKFCPILDFYSLNSKCVYSINHHNIAKFYENYKQENNKFLCDEHIIGFHWYAGSKESKQFESQFSPNSLYSFNNIIRKAVEI